MSLSDHRQAYAYCAFCPKGCRFACPVSAASHNETHSTWGKMTEAYLLTQAKRAIDREGAEALYACSGCMRCRTFCHHQNEVGFALAEARSLAVEAQVAPDGIASLLQTFAVHRNPHGKDLSELVARYRTENPVRYALFPGCSVLAQSPHLVDEALELSNLLGAPAGVCRASSKCCGYPLYAAGDQLAFVAQARVLAEALKDYPELIVLDPECAYTLKVVYPRFGVRLESRVHTLYEVLASHLGEVGARPRLPAEVAYHDACHLGRGLGEYDAPRQLLRAAVGEFAELPEHRAEAGCSGAGGFLPQALPELSAGVARQLSSTAAGKTLVTGCPNARRHLEQSGGKAVDLITLLRRWLQPSSS